MYVAIKIRQWKIYNLCGDLNHLEALHLKRTEKKVTVDKTIFVPLAKLRIDFMAGLMRYFRISNDDHFQLVEYQHRQSLSQF